MKTFENISTLDSLSQILKVPKKKLTYILYVKRIENLYTSFEIPKKIGGERTISSPSTDLKEIQVNIAELLRKQQTVFWEENNIEPNIAHAFNKKKSIMTNANLHKHKRYVLNIDLENFFDSFHFGRVRGYFEKNKNFLFPQNVATILAQLTCYNGKLPQGAPTSPIITNLICNVLDMKLLKIAKKFRLVYSRYADDLTFSTNDKSILENLEEFLAQLEFIVNKSGFMINRKKTRLQYKDSKQVVTGLVVNEKVNVNRLFYKETRSMADTLYKTGEFRIGDDEGNLNRLEGRFSFINQIDRFNNKIGKGKNIGNKESKKLNGRERQYQMFLFYKYFYCNTKPCLITEGKTDIIYIKSALKKMYLSYPNLIEKNSDGTFHFKFLFLRRSKRMRYFFELKLDGADTMSKIYNFYCDTNNHNYPNYVKKFTEKSVSPINPTILIYDNELKNKDKLLSKITNTTKIRQDEEKYNFLKTNHYVNITSNLYVLTHQLVKGLPECEIEDLFDSNTLKVTINDKTFERDLKKFDENKNYGKAIFAGYISKNYLNINFDEFKPLLDNLNTIVTLYNLNSQT
ncbi:retron Ec67 family RNA-directed DNA polymerase/endonuclease [Enterococcus casseliflavus]|uniref:retron Ec67 family RNA-directed DNA polymerase/endonuclease n=1 Tax=Enterococcus casseliflavus TaxID=37734 RepID=UPI003397BF9F